MRVPPAEPSGRCPVIGDRPFVQELFPAAFPVAVGSDPATSLSSCPNALQAKEQATDLPASLGLGLLGQ